MIPVYGKPNVIISTCKMFYSNIKQKLYENNNDLYNITFIGILS